MFPTMATSFEFGIEKIKAIRAIAHFLVFDCFLTVVTGVIAVLVITKVAWF